MGYDLEPMNPDQPWFHIGGFSFPWILGEGVGLIIGYAKTHGAGFVYQPRPITVTDGETGETREVMVSPMDNDGFPVDAEEAMAMAHAAYGLVSVEEFIRREWEEKSEEERARIEALPYASHLRPRTPVRKDFVEKAEAFAAWAEKSGGFRIR